MAMKIKKIWMLAISVILMIDLAFFPYLFEGQSLFKSGLEVYKYLISVLIIIIFWIYFVINFIPKIEDSLSYKISLLSIADRHRKSFDYHYKIIFKIISFLIFFIVLLLFFLVVKNFIYLQSS